MQKKIYVLILVSILLLTSYGTTQTIGLKTNNSEIQTTSISTIQIEGNTQFTSQNGVINPNAEGTINDYYIIKGTNLNNIQISNTNKYFVIKDSSFSVEGSGISLNNVQNGIIKNCEFNNNINSADVVFIGSNNNVVENCSMSNNNNGNHFFFIALNSDNNKIHHCKIKSRNNNVKNNGIALINSNNNEIHHCEISGGEYGIAIQDSNNNQIYQNTIYENDLNAKIYSGINTWDDGNKGNYWDDYTGRDSDKDGIGDTTYVIDQNNVDRYPMMSGSKTKSFKFEIFSNFLNRLKNKFNTFFNRIYELIQNVKKPIKTYENKENTGSIKTCQNSDGWLEEQDGVKILHLSGSNYEMGYQHGELLNETIEQNLNAQINYFENAGWDYDSIYSKFNEIKDNLPQKYLDEIRGIADGCAEKDGQVFGRPVDKIDILAINQMFEYMTRFENQKKAFHPLKDLFNTIKDFIPSDSDFDDETSFIETFLNAPKSDHCNAFIATGDATTNGQMVAAQGIRCGGWWYPYYIAQRWNIALDIDPANGHRFQMSSCPGYIWSDANFYQSEEGIIIMDTTLSQGYWKDSGYSMVIRTRKAIQYSNNLDEAIDCLMEKNDGLWTAAYLLGDTETGEIARLDLGLYAYEIWRTFDGFYISDNNAKNPGVRAEANGLGLKGLLFRFINPGSGVHAYFTRRYIPAPRGVKLEEQGNKYYGDIDIDVLRHKIMFEEPICDSGSTDVKATDTNLIKQNSFWGFWGRVNGEIWDTSDQQSNLEGVKNVPPAGWTLICGIPENHGYTLDEKIYTKPTKDSMVAWEYDFAEEYPGRNQWYANIDYNNETIYAAGLNGYLYSLNAINGEKHWSKKINNYGGLSPTWINSDDESIYAGWENSSSAIEPDTGDIRWTNYDAKHISSQPAVVDNKVFFGNRDGEIYALSKKTGRQLWATEIETEKVYISMNQENGIITAAAGTKCYGLDIENGNIKWTYTTNGLIVSSPIVIDETVYFGSSDTKIYALNINNGNEKWSQETGWAILSTPTCSEEQIYVTSMDNHLYSFNKNNGEMLWSFATNASIHSSPTIYGEYVFFGSDDGRFYAVNKTNGEHIWNYQPAYSIEKDVYNYITTPILSNSEAEDGKIYFSANGNIYSLYARTTETEKQIDNNEILTKENIIAVLLLLAILLVVAILLYPKKSKK